MESKPRRIKPAKGSYFKLLRVADRCPNCKTKLSKRRFTVLYKEFLECNVCGNNWMQVDPDSITRFT